MEPRSTRAPKPKPTKRDAIRHFGPAHQSEWCVKRKQRHILGFFFGQIRKLSISFVLAGVVAGCAGSPEVVRADRLLVLDAPPVITARDIETSARASDAALAYASGPVPRASRRIEPQAAAVLYNTDWGRAFLGAQAGRAIARGEPAERCPGLGVVAGTPETPTGAIVEIATTQCLRSLAAAGVTDCGCRVIAVNDTLLAPLTEFVHAPGIGARLIGLGSVSTAGPLVAREQRDLAADGSRRLLLGNASGPVATAALFPDGAAVLELEEGGIRLEGRRDLVGWRRGRLAERLLLRTPDGRRVIALIGFEPEDYVREGLTLARWPRAKG